MNKNDKIMDEISKTSMFLTQNVRQMDLLMYSSCFEMTRFVR